MKIKAETINIGPQLKITCSRHFLDSQPSQLMKNDHQPDLVLAIVSLYALTHYIIGNASLSEGIWPFGSVI